MSLFSRACMIAIALAAIALPLASAPQVEARDRHEGGSRNRDRNFNSTRSDITGGNMPWRTNLRRGQHNSSRHDGDRDRNRGGQRGNDFNFTSGDITGGNINDRRWRRNNGWRNDWRFDRNWRADRNDWGRDWNGPVRNWGANSLGPDWNYRGRPYYAGPSRPYYSGPAYPYYRGQSEARDNIYNNFYGGAISAYDDPGNGVYFYYDEYGDGGGRPPSFAAQPAPQAKVISISPQTENAACSWEQGVCVIRP